MSTAAAINCGYYTCNSGIHIVVIAALASALLDCRLQYFQVNPALWLHLTGSPQLNTELWTEDRTFMAFESSEMAY